MSFFPLLATAKRTVVSASEREVLGSLVATTQLMMRDAELTP